MEQRRGPGKPFHSAGGIRGGILPALLRDAQVEFRTGAQASWQKKRLRAASSALVGPVRAALEADGEIVRRLAGRYAFDALQLGRALNDYYHHEQLPGAFVDLQERIGRTARTLRRGVLNEHGLQGSDRRGETFAKTCADQAVRGLRRRVLASLIMAMNRDERGCLAFRQDNFALRGKTRTVESKIRAPRRRSDKKPENAGEAVEKTMQRAIEGAPRLAQDTGSRVLADATVDVAAEHDMLAVWRAATGECRFCRDMDGKPVDMGDGRGVHMLPPAHDGCTCTVELTAREKVYPKKREPDFDRIARERKADLQAHPEKALPGAENAKAASAKFTGYLFAPNNPRGWAKGVAITKRLGYNIDNWQDLRTEILEAAKAYPATIKGDRGHGMRYEQKVILSGVNGKAANVKIGWIVQQNETYLTTVFMEEVED